MDLPRLLALKEHWKSHPPLNVTARLIAQAVGIEFTSAPGSKSPTDQDAAFSALIAQMQQGPTA